MKQRLVYRIEDADGYGPFQDPDAQRAIDVERYNDNVADFPTPANDPGFDWSTLDGDRFVKEWTPFGPILWAVGCCSRVQLQHWFDAAVCQALAGLGFSFTVWRIADDLVVEGKFQALFDRDEAECLERYPACALWQSELQQAA